MKNSAKVSMTMNTSGLHPQGVAVLVEPVKNDLKTTLIELPQTVQERSMMVEMHAKVVEIGPEAWIKEKAPRARIGDRVLISRWSGNIVTGPLDSKLYRMVNAEDIFCTVDKEVNANVG